MSAREQDKDLFAKSTMTFGEHLEELRSCLIKSLVALVLGTLVGLIFGGNVVDLIKSPLEKALTKYYEEQTTEELTQALAAERPDGRIAAGETDQINEFIQQNHLLTDRVLVNPAWVIHELRRHDPQRFGSPAEGVDKLPIPRSMDDLVPIMLFRPTQDDSRVYANSLTLHEPFMIWVKASLLVGVLLASPYIFYQIWAFVAAGLYRHEQYYVRMYLPISLGLFILGAALAFFFVFEPVLTFLLSFNKSMGINTEPRITDWMSFVLIMPLGFGISFQLPLVMLFLERIGVFNVNVYLEKWRAAIMVICIVSMFLTPADPYSMILMAVPLIFLYFGGILLCKYLPRRGSPFDEA